MAAVQYASCCLTESEQMYRKIGKQAAGAGFALRKFRHRFPGGPFIVYSDHKAL